ncbi:MAG TPA: hypothetical protein VH877_24840 [Polyangia bacterium]|nr:hypothetical protein [Polyangia bacterium]
MSRALSSGPDTRQDPTPGALAHIEPGESARQRTAADAQAPDDFIFAVRGNEPRQLQPIDPSQPYTLSGRSRDRWL